MGEKRDIERLLQIVRKNTVLRGGAFTLSSGLKTSIYFDEYMAVLSPEGAELVGKVFFDILVSAGVEAVGGPTSAADTIVVAVAVISHQQGVPISGFFVRKERKKHGTQKQIEGPLRDGSRVAIVDNVITTGRSILNAIAAAEARRCQVVKVVVLIDRQQGGLDELRRRGYDFTAILSADPSGEVCINK